MHELNEVLSLYRPSDEINLRFVDVPFKVLTNSHELADKIRTYFSSWLCEKPSGRSHVLHAFQGNGIYDAHKLQDIDRREGKRIKEAYYDSDNGRVILKKRTGATVYINDNERFVVGDLILHLHQLVNVIDEVFEEDFMSRGYSLIHASAAVINGKAVMITSASGAGKSTTALALVEMGFKFASNDRVLIRVDDDIVHCVGVPKKPRVNPGTILSLSSLNNIIPASDRSLYAGMGRDELWELEHKFDADVDALYGPGTFILESILDSIYILNWKRETNGIRIELLTRDEGYSALRPNVLNLDIRRRQASNPEETEEHINRICLKTPLFNVKGGVDIYGLASLIKNRYVP